MEWFRAVHRCKVLTEWFHPNNDRNQIGGQRTAGTPGWFFDKYWKVSEMIKLTFAMLLAAQASNCLGNFAYVRHGQEENAVRVYEDTLRD